MEKIFKQSALMLRLPALLDQAKRESLFQTDNENIGIVSKSIEYISNLVINITSKIKAGDVTILNYSALLYKQFEKNVGSKNTTISYLITFNAFCTEYRLMLAKTVYDISIKQNKKIKAYGVQKPYKNLNYIKIINERNESVARAEAEHGEVEAHVLILLEAIGVGSTITKNEVQVLIQKLLHYTKTTSYS